MLQAFFFTRLVKDEVLPLVCVNLITHQQCESDLIITFPADDLRKIGPYSMPVEPICMGNGRVVAAHHDEVDLFVWVIRKRSKLKILFSEAVEGQGNRIRRVGPELVKVPRVGLMPPMVTQSVNRCSLRSFSRDSTTDGESWDSWIVT